MRKGIIFFLVFNINSLATITLTKISDPSMGIIFSGSSSRQFILGTDGSMTGSDSSDYISGATAGNITIQDNSSPLSIVITATNIIPTGGLTVNRVLCSYNGGGETRCDGTGYAVSSVANATLLLGLDVTTSQIHSGGDSATVSFDIEVIYQ